MALQWFRMYSEFSDDPKVQMMSEAMQRRLVMLLCDRCKGEAITDAMMAFRWRVPPVEAQQTKVVFMAQGFIDENWTLLNWNKRQFVSDDATERVKRFRAKNKVTTMKRYSNGDVTAEERFTDVPREENDYPIKKYF
jgi:hypothetical protein